MFERIGDKVVESAGQQRVVECFRVKSSADKCRRDVGHITGDQVLGQLGTFHVPQRGVDRVDQVEAGIDQSAVEVEDDQPERGRIELAMEFDQGCT